jgi:hypothetical protein
MMSVYPHPRQTQRDSQQGAFSQAATGASAVIRQPLFLPRFNERATFALIKASATVCGQPFEKLELEIVSQIRNAFPHRWQPKYRHAFARNRARLIRRARVVVR